MSADTEKPLCSYLYKRRITLKKRITIRTRNGYGTASLLLAISLISSSVFGSEDSTQLDRIESKVGTVITTQKEILEAIDDEPLLGKKYGIEINPLRLLFIDKNDKTFSGSFSFFNVKPNVEISLPIFVSSSKNDTREISVLTIDGHYRYFLGKRTNGFYISGFSRFATLEGTLNNAYSTFGENKNGRTYKLGGGFGIGYRVFSKRGFYWGASLSLGRYLIGKSNQYRSSDYDITDNIDDEEFIFDVEFFKIGYAF